MIKNEIILIAFLISFVLLTQVNALTTNSSDKTFFYTITSNTNNNQSSENFKNYLVVGNINGDMSSSNFKTTTGFLITAPFLDDETCEVASECVGGFCCSNSCKNTACSTTTASGGSGVSSGGSKTGLITKPDVRFDVKILEFDVLGGKLIDQLFDITFSLEDSTLDNSDQLEAIVTFESFGIKPVPIKLGNFFNFTYFLKVVGDVNNDVTLDFKIEQNGEVITTGSDVIYMGSFEEKTETARLFLPNNITSGKYSFIVQVKHGNYIAESHRTIYLTVSGEEGTIIPAVDLTFIILYENGNEIYREKDSITVETEKVLRKTFKGLNLSEGKYTIILQTFYNADVFDEFRQNFRIGIGIDYLTILKEYLLLIMILPIAIIILTLIVMKRKRIKNFVKKSIFFKIKDKSKKAKKERKKSKKEYHLNYKKLIKSAAIFILILAVLTLVYVTYMKIVPLSKFSMLLPQDMTMLILTGILSLAVTVIIALLFQLRKPHK